MSTRWLEVAAIFSEAREKGRAWLDFDEWELVFAIWREMGARDGPLVGIPVALQPSIAATYRRVMVAKERGRTAKDEHFRHEWQVAKDDEDRAMRADHRAREQRARNEA